ncbi:DUF4220 domain-containing protein [Cephalotus follicularis]|uniref:DUF4220 domain-containing protein n=1 Tax=Cephalotus follicularis TaxID=3775 RepID=A0A1Q3BY05_CEPFO|nr:DUF4220 domain-containing protein [Cephalotus follicularis]
MGYKFSIRTMVYWNKWEIRGMILLSLFLQIFLIIFGKQRQYVARKLVGNLVWLAYLSADWVANFILGLMSSEQGDNARPRNALLAFWAPFLLVHLGGIDTISAFSLEDNELWTRHLLQLLGHIVGVIYVFFRTWNSDDLIFVAFLIFFTGIIKYGERTMALRHASTEQLRESLNLNGLTNAQKSDSTLSTQNDEWPANYEGCIHEAYALFEIMLKIYSGTILRLPLHKRTYEILKKKSATQAFKIIEVELGFMYDWLYTKVPVVYTPIGASFRFSCCLCYISALFVFLNIIHKQNYSHTDNAISYTLLIGSLVLEIYAILVLVFSDWAMLWFSKQRKPLTDCFYHGFYTSCLRSLFINKKRWSGSMAQFNFISFCSLKVTN